MLFLRPDDRSSRPLISTSSPSNNVLLKITVPKRTGRKRKRGSDEPFEEESQNEKGGIENTTDRRDTRYLLQSLRDNLDLYEVEAIGSIERSHVFRGELTLFGAEQAKVLTIQRDARLRLLDHTEPIHEAVQRENTTL